MRNNKSKTKNKAFNFQHRVNKHATWKTSTSSLKAQVSSTAPYGDEEGDESDDDDYERDESDENNNEGDEK